MKKLSFFVVMLVLLASMLACQLSPDLITINPGTEPEEPQQEEPAQPSAPLPTVDTGGFLQPTLAPTPDLPPIDQGTQGQENLLVALYERVNPGVVSIQVLSDQGGGGLGSGFVIDQQGNIVTNYHVVEGATQVEVDFPSGFKTLGEIVGTDLDSDIAVVRVNAPPEQLAPLSLGNSDQLRVGQTVVAIGNPYGLSSTLTVGVISAKGRTLESLRQTDNGRPFTAGDIIQTDASINPGNSGGPLLNLNGEVIGVNRAIRTAGVTDSGDPVNTGIGFAVSINIVKRVIPTLIQGEEYNYPYLGLSSQEDLSLIARQELGLNRTTGAYVTEVVAGGPADEAGLRAGTRNTGIPGLQSGGDLIIAVDGRPVQVFGDLLSYLMTNKSPGDQIVLTVVRNNEEQEVTVTLGRRP